MPISTAAPKTGRDISKRVLLALIVAFAAPAAPAFAAAILNALTPSGRAKLEERSVRSLRRFDWNYAIEAYEASIERLLEAGPPREGGDAQRERDRIIEEARHEGTRLLVSARGELERGRRGQQHH